MSQPRSSRARRWSGVSTPSATARRPSECASCTHVATMAASPRLSVSPATKDRSKAFELKQELDRLGLFKEYEDRFLDLFKKTE